MGTDARAVTLDVSAQGRWGCTGPWAWLTRPPFLPPASSGDSAPEETFQSGRPGWEGWATYGPVWGSVPP